MQELKILTEQIVAEQVNAVSARKQIQILEKSIASVNILFILKIINYLKKELI